MAMRQHRDAVGQGQRLGLIMRDVDGRLAEPALQAAELVAHLDPQLQVQVGERLVEHQDLWFEHQRAGDRNPLLLPARELRRETLAQPGKLDELKGAVDPFPHLRLGDAPQPQAESDVVEHAEMREQRIILEHEPDIAAVRRPVVEAFAAQPDRAFAQALEAGDAAQGRRLAAAARSQ